MWHSSTELTAPYGHVPHMRTLYDATTRGGGGDGADGGGDGTHATPDKQGPDASGVAQRVHPVRLVNELELHVIVDPADICTFLSGGLAKSTLDREPLYSA